MGPSQALPGRGAKPCRIGLLVKIFLFVKKEMILGAKNGVFSLKIAL